MESNIIGFGYREEIELKEDAIPIVKEEGAIFSSIDHIYKVETYLIINQNNTIQYKKQDTYPCYDLDSLNYKIDLLENSGYKHLDNIENICGIKEGYSM